MYINILTASSLLLDTAGMYNRIYVRMCSKSLKVN